MLQTPKILIVKILVIRRDNTKGNPFCFVELYDTFIFKFANQARDSTVSMYRVEIPVAIVIKQQMF